MNILIKNVSAVTMNDSEPFIDNAYIAVVNGKISYIGKDLPEGDFEREIDGKGKIAMPGLINTHTHLPMTVLRGYADGYDLQTWLNDYIFPAESKMDAKCVKAGATLGIAESIKFGVTSVSEMYFKIPSIADAAFKAGIKANICNGATCFNHSDYDFDKAGETAEMREMLKTWHNADDGRIRLDVGVHGEYTSFDELWRKNAQFALENGLNMQVHVSETRKEHTECLARNGMTPIETLSRAGVFDTRSTAAHCVFITKNDMDIMCEKNVTAAHNPVSNLKLASGVADICEMRNHSVNVSLGTDGVSSNNSHDLFEEIKLSSLLQKGIGGNAAAMPAYEALKLATVNGAYAQKRENECGALIRGMDADIILINADLPQIQPIHSYFSALCYSTSGRDVYLNMVRGNIIYEKGVFMTIDIEKALEEAKDAAKFIS